MNFIPTLVTEDVTVLAVTKHGCIGESRYGMSVVCLNAMPKWITWYLLRFMFLQVNLTRFMRKDSKD